MASLNSLKAVLTREAIDASSVSRQPLSDEQYRDGYTILTRGPGKLAYDEFVIPELSKALSRFATRAEISVLEIGPGPESVLARVPLHIRRLITNYTALEPNNLFATKLEARLGQGADDSSVLPSLKAAADIRRRRFTADEFTSGDRAKNSREEVFDVILFCHSMYDMKPRRAFLEKALGMLAPQPESGGVVVVFHGGESFDAGGLVCHQTAVFPTSRVSVENDDVQLDHFAAFIAGFFPRHANANQALLPQWRQICREMGEADGQEQNSLSFSCPVVMVTFTVTATTLPQLVTKVPAVQCSVKNRYARLQRSAACVQPKSVEDVQFCVRWAIENGLRLTVISGGHSDNCIRSNVVAIDMSTFSEVHACKTGDGDSWMIVAGSGCNIKDIVHTAMEMGLVVPLGTRPSIGAGLWLQGGIGHLTRQYGLTCDAIIGAVLVTVDTGQVVYAGNVPHQYRPLHATRAKDEAELLWALKGAGTNFGVVISVIFGAFPCGTFGVRSWSDTAKSPSDAQSKLCQFEASVANELPNHVSADVYLYQNAGQLHLGYTVFEHLLGDAQPHPLLSAYGGGGSARERRTVMDSIELFDADLYMTGMQGSHHGGGKTSSFRRCVFLKDIGSEFRARALVKAYTSKPSALCYLHLLHGGGAASDWAGEDTAFGCRDWQFACVITGVWPREEDERHAARMAKDWVYKVATELVPLSSGVYGADLGSDARDRMLARMAFGPNLALLSRMKTCWDPFTTLAYTCPLEEKGLEQKLILLVTGDSGAGKDRCAVIWATSFARRQVCARVVSISDGTKEEYARERGVDVRRLLHDRSYKEEHREGLTAFFRAQVRQRPELPEEHFKAVVAGADEAPVATFAHLAPEKKVMEIRITCDDGARDERRAGKGCDGIGGNGASLASWGSGKHESIWHDSATGAGAGAADYCPDLVFDNSRPGDEEAVYFAEQKLLPLASDKVGQLAKMVGSTSNFPRAGIEFRHVLNIAQQPEGLKTCTVLLQERLSGDWAAVEAVVGCEAGGFIYASALALQVGKRMVAVRERGKLPPPTASTSKWASHISLAAGEEQVEGVSDGVEVGVGVGDIDIGRDAIAAGAGRRVVVVDDVLASGRTLCAVLRLLGKVGVDAERVSVLVVAEFPRHCGRRFLKRNGFGRVDVQSLLVLGGE